MKQRTPATLLAMHTNSACPANTLTSGARDISGSFTAMPLRAGIRNQAVPGN